MPSIMVDMEGTQAAAAVAMVDTQVAAVVATEDILDVVGMAEVAVVMVEDIAATVAVAVVIMGEVAGVVPMPVRRSMPKLRLNLRTKAGYITASLQLLPCLHRVQVLCIINQEMLNAS